jgi:cytoskeletal protein CcmA (bactofilin family)
LTAFAAKRTVFGFEQKRRNGVRSEFGMSGTVIGNSLVINGEIFCDEDLEIEGTVRGRVAMQGHLLISRDGVVEADIESDAVEIEGLVTGNIVALDSVNLTPGGRAIGDIRSPRIHISDGATFKGKVDISGQ